MKNNRIELIEYTRAQDLSFAASHAAGALFGLFALVISFIKTGAFGSITQQVSALIYCLTFIAVYAISAVYHALRPGRAKAAARRLDHMAIPLLLAGTATPCALVSLYRVSPAHGIAVCAAGWFCAAFGVITKLFFFNNEKLKTAAMAVYFTGGAAMLFSAVPRLGEINKTAFLLLAAGCVLYAAGAVFCRMGIKKAWYHLPFHILVLAGSIVQFFTIYHYVL